MNNNNYRNKLIEHLQNLEESASEDEIRKATLTYLGKNYPEMRDGIWRSRIGSLVAPLGILALAASFILMCIPFNKPVQKILDFLCYGIWLIVPPLWFFIEYNFFFPPILKQDSVQFNDLKYTQELASKVWAGIVVFISAILVGRYAR